MMPEKDHMEARDRTAPLPAKIYRQKKEYRDYWKSKFADIPPLKLPFDRPPLLTRTFRISSEHFLVSQALVAALKRLSQREGVNLSLLLLAAFQTLLYRYTDQADISISAGTSSSPSCELENQMPWRADRLIVRLDLTDNPSFLQLLQRVHHEVLETVAYQDLLTASGEECANLWEEVGQYNPCQIEVILQSGFEFLLDLSEQNLPAFPSHKAISQPDLRLSIAEREELTGTLEYNAEMFDSSTIARMVVHFQQLLENIVAQPTLSLLDLPLLSEIERRQLLIDWSTRRENATVDAPFSHLFEAQVKRTPEAIALCCDEVQITYAFLNELANHLAHDLLTRGVRLEDRVGVSLERSIEAIVAFLALFKIGATYVPLDPAYPQERLSFLLADAQMSIILAKASKAQMANTVKIVELGEIEAGHPAGSEVNPSIERRANNLAYMIYTSGSTGTPKGVLIQNSGFSALIQSQIQNWYVNPQSRVLQFASLSFDASLSEIGMSLLAGATLCLRTGEKATVGVELANVLIEEAITHITLPPSILKTLPEETHFLALQALIVAGEECPAQLASRWGSHYPLFNAYGPTEGTIGVTFAKYTHESHRLPISGQKFPHAQTFILDRHLQPVPIGCVGEIYIAGPGLARGYHNRPDLTAEKFLPHPFSQIPGDRLYKSGDLARYLANGEIEYVGRADKQLKLRGFRIEPGEIEAVLTRHPIVREAVVMAREDIPGRKRLIAYIVLVQEQARAILDIRAFLKEHLPEYMIPSAFVRLTALPLLISGKVNYSALPAPDPFEESVREVFAAPHTEIEKSLAFIWSEVLGIPWISIYDDFFELGGDSLLSFEVLTRVKEQYHLSLSVQALFGKTMLADSVQVITEALQTANVLQRSAKGNI